MSSTIKRPGSDSTIGVDGSLEPSGTEGARGSEGAGAEFRAALESAGAAQPSSGTAAPNAASGLDRAALLRSLAEDLRAGRLDARQAVDRLVERALAGASGLSSARRAELETVLRSTLAEDPTLAALQRDLSRDR